MCESNLFKSMDEVKKDEWDEPVLLNQKTDTKKVIQKLDQINNETFKKEDQKIKKQTKNNLKNILQKSESTIFSASIRWMKETAHEIRNGYLDWDLLSDAERDLYISVRKDRHIRFDVADVVKGHKDKICCCYYCVSEDDIKQVGLPPCEYVDHHCDTCHLKGICTKAEC